MEFDAYRSDLEFYSSAPQTEVNLSKQRETEESFTKQKQDFEKLRSDVQIKLKFLDENRVTNNNIKVSYLNHPITLIAIHDKYNSTNTYDVFLNIGKSNAQTTAFISQCYLCVFFWK